jgi:ABC-type arginine/histidine transport system permease subunit
LPVIVTLVGWLMAIRGAVLLALSPSTTMKLFEALRYEQLFYVYMGTTLILGLYLTYAGFSA